MSLRLLPAFIMDNDDDDDGNFTKWMSSYWGHGAEGGAARDRKRSFRRPARSQADRRASLPSVSQLDAMKLSKLHAATMAPAPSHTKAHEERAEVRQHPRARRCSSDDSGRTKASVPEKRISTIPELAESLQERLRIREQRSGAQTNDERSCLICHQDAQELHCSHRFHKEAAARRLESRPHHSSSSSSSNEAAAAAAAAAPQLRRPSDERRKSADGPITSEREQPALRRQLSLRRHR